MNKKNILIWLALGGVAVYLIMKNKGPKAAANTTPAPAPTPDLPNPKSPEIVISDEIKKATDGELLAQWQWLNCPVNTGIAGGLPQNIAIREEKAKQVNAEVAKRGLQFSCKPVRGGIKLVKNPYGPLLPTNSGVVPSKLGLY